MKSKTFAAMVLAAVVLIAAGLFLGSGDVEAQPAVKRVERVAPNIKVDPAKARICPKPDLRAWENFKLSPKDEFPFSSQCKSCWEQAGVMNLPDMSVWIINIGMADAPATQAKLTFDSGKPPYAKQSITANVPALKKGEKHLLVVDAPYTQGKPHYLFQVAKPITLELDSSKKVDECNEGNNVLTYTYQ